ncbi:MAG: hypothetical protein ACXABY_31965 [Candidatus Thorarchaeota archaeon]|jgi:hypothetical protein
MKQPTLFDMPAPELVMVIEDAADPEDDPQIAYLKRRGYTTKQIESLRQSIAKKKTIDWVLGGTESLNGQEAAFMEQIDTYTDQLRQQRCK